MNNTTLFYWLLYLIVWLVLTFLIIYKPSFYGANGSVNLSTSFLVVSAITLISWGLMIFGLKVIDWDNDI